jgi:hypothetical protein
MNEKKSNLGIVVAGLLIGIFIAAMDNTIVATAMGSIVADLGGLDKFVWVTSAYMVAEMSGMPIFGKLSCPTKQTRKYEQQDRQLTPVYALEVANSGKYKQKMCGDGLCVGRPPISRRVEVSLNAETIRYFGDIVPQRTHFSYDDRDESNCCAMVKPMRYAVAEVLPSTVNGTMEASATSKSSTP